MNSESSRGTPRPDALDALDALRAEFDMLTAGLPEWPPIPVMKARLSSKVQIKSREITFIGFREKDGELCCFMSAGQMWSDYYFAELAAKNPGPLGTPHGEQMKMLIPYEEVVKFFEEIKRQHDKSVAEEGICF